MVCYNPILMYPVEGAITKNGKQHYSFYGSLASHPELAGDSRFIRCSCKQCIGCRLENSRQWAVRAVHEARSSSSAYFVTCTFDDYYLPRDKSLSKKFHQTFNILIKITFHTCHFSLNIIKSGGRISTISRSNIIQNSRAKVRALKTKVFKL